MVTRRSRAIIGGVAAALFIGLTSSAYGFLGYNNGRSGGPRLVQVRGKVVCAACSLAEARQAQSRHKKYTNHLFALTYGQEQVVMEVEWISNPAWLSYLTTQHLRLRGDHSLFRELTAAERQAKSVEVTARLTNPWTLDMTAVAVNDVTKVAVNE